MKRFFILATVLIIVLSGCSKDSPANKMTSIQQNSPVEGGGEVQEPVRESVFKNEDVDKAKKLAREYVAIITSFHGRKAHTTQDIDNLQSEMSIKIKNSIPIHSQSRVTRLSGTERNEDDILELSASRMSISSDEAKEVYYKHINVSELIIFMEYTIPGKYAKNEPKQYRIRFVKTMDNQVQIIKDGFFIGGPDLEKKDQEDSYSLDKNKLKNELQIQ
ncbi:hypothetical protein [Paenibacillus crassostreae]|uniref:Lipoprotein n=1 Tax=Paenibacillus crassostreae TaxID=1763538 RepID=A0A167EKH1_9BACL|nr:hypothetical protein [Paenibacillus crassostreae]AOZ94876.1 hypothetical protein LPB68_21675 [Paenibacillus crassostreae]OAB75631.1 hypothetical protein PNBC_08365 [Paenibacillus crassostreae]